MGHAREFPPRCEVPIELVRQAFKEFIAGGGAKPACVQWMPYLQC
ncbi:Imm1 family immunity protein [Dactylosporangium sp. CS-033363]